MVRLQQYTNAYRFYNLMSLLMVHAAAPATIMPTAAPVAVTAGKHADLAAIVAALLSHNVLYARSHQRC
jgi:hypothetical protein